MWVKTPGKSIDIDFDDSDTFATMKQKVEEKTGLKISDQIWEIRHPILDMITSDDSSESEISEKKVEEPIVQIGGAPKKRGKHHLADDATEKYSSKTERIRNLNEWLNVASTRMNNSPVKSNVVENTINVMKQFSTSLTQDASGKKTVETMVDSLAFDELSEYVAQLSGQSSHNTQHRFSTLSDLVFKSENDQVESLKTITSLCLKVYPMLTELALVHKFADASGAFSWVSASKYLNEVCRKKLNDDEKKKRRDASTSARPDGSNNDDDENDDDDDKPEDDDEEMIPEKRGRGRPKKSIAS